MKRSITVNIRLTPEEYTAIREAAESRGLQPAVFVRSEALDSARNKRVFHWTSGERYIPPGTAGVIVAPSSIVTLQPETTKGTKRDK